MDYSVLLVTIMRLAVLLGIGMFLTYKISFSADVRKFMIFVIINIALPAIILHGFLQVEIDDHLMQQIVMIFIFSLIFNLAGLLLGYIFGKSIGLDSLKARETGFLAIFGNTGLIGIPFCAALFGAKGAVFAAVFDAGMSLTLWTVGALMIRGKTKLTLNNLKSMISVPNVAVVIGLTITVFQINPGFFIKDVTATLAGASSPLAMFYIGMLTMTIIREKKKISAKLIAIPVTFKLLIFPLLGVIALSMLSLSNEVEQVLLVEMAMPAVTSASIILALYNADENYGVMNTLFTNLLSLLTIPLIFFIGSIWI
ncbi:AEC family transporter [Bacillus sp. Marseille-P3661]|uniref:AEC family transporter n=1 Tax=Bacillus sp. Marseille-P3661 TaxID=1936234 RepID=UPI000C859F46|nr:AEC family transporter [Bacillus sp. Marseille-P3661]